MSDEDLREPLSPLTPIARNALRRVLIFDHADRDAIATELIHYGDEVGSTGPTSSTRSRCIPTSDDEEHGEPSGTGRCHPSWSRYSVRTMTDLGVFAAILDNSERLLLCRRRDVDLWEMPGGRVEAGESPWDALGREVSEETGLTVELFRLVGLYWRPRRELLVLQFEVACRGRPVTSPEVREVGFFSMDPLPEPINPAVIERIEDLRGGSRAVQLRTQLGPSGQELLAAWQQLQGT